MSRRATAAWVSGAASAAIAAGLAIWSLWPGSGGRADADDARQVAAGASLYAAHCARCHGADLEGQPDWRSRKPDGRLPAPPHDARGHTWHHPDEFLFRITKFGMVPPLAPPDYESDMPAYSGTLTDDQIWAVLAYIKSTWPPRVRTRQAELGAAARSR